MTSKRSSARAAMSWDGTTRKARPALNAAIENLSINGIFRVHQSVESVMTIVIRVKSSGASNTRNEVELSTVASANGTGGNEEIL